MPLGPLARCLLLLLCSLPVLPARSMAQQRSAEVRATVPEVLTFDLRTEGRPKASAASVVLTVRANASWSLLVRQAPSSERRRGTSVWWRLRTPPASVRAARGPVYNLARSTPDLVAAGHSTNVMSLAIDYRWQSSAASPRPTELVHYTLVAR